MAISPIEFSGSIPRMTDVSLMRNQEENKAFADLSSNLHQVEKNVKNEREAVVKKNAADYHQERYDAKEKGKGSYEGNSDRNKKKKEEDGQVVVKQTSRFDVKI
ncbi:MAG: hypothetical protein PUE21_05345 [Lachnospiraceae bacterium]|nr:hypothetical protein [Lachnospiraceae bacterium]